MENRIEVMKDETGQYCERAFIWCPTEWQKAGLQETATGYGSRLNSGFKVHYAGRMRRVYIVCHSNVGSMYVMVKGERTFLGV
jgi:hypothetical protein